jgi:hypothetical protein
VDVTLLAVAAPHFFAGIVVNAAGKIAEAAPILGWTVGRDAEWFVWYAGRKGWKVEQAPAAEP